MRPPRPTPWLALIFAWAAPHVAHAASEGAEATPAEEGWAAFPALGYTPRTSLVVGGVVVRSFRTGDRDAKVPSRPSSVRLLGVYSLTHQYAGQLVPDVYLDKERWHVWGELAARRRPDQLYEPGNDTTAETSEPYTTDDLGVRVRPSMAIFGPVRLGVHAGIAVSRVRKTRPGGLLESGALEGSEGATLVGAGPAIILDDRDDNLSPRRGRHFLLQLELYRRALGGRTDTGIHTLDLRHYLDLSPGWVLASQVYAKTVTGEAPFQVMAELGGDRRMRGFVGGRYRDRAMAVAQEELRFPLSEGLGGVLFVATGRVAGSLPALRPTGLKVTGGGGLRYRISASNRMALRVDAAGSGEGDVHGYVTFGQAY